MTSICGFFGEYRFLSNFNEDGFTLCSGFYKSNEHYFQAMKAANEQDHQWVMESATPGIAKHRGRRIPLRPDWDTVKLRVMKEGLRAKFDQNPELKAKLLATGSAYLEETNHWGDQFWGKSGGKGLNHLGEMLMELRDSYRMDEFYG